MKTTRISVGQLAVFSRRIEDQWLLPRNDSRPRRATGYSLFEVLATIGIVSILTSLAAPSYKAIAAHNRMISSSNEIRSAAQLARNTAISLNRHITFCAGRLDVGCHGNWSRHEWLVFQDIDRDGVVDSGEPVYLAAGINVSTSINIFSNGPLKKRVIFTGAGTAETANGAFAAGRLRLCASDDTTANAIDLILIGSGRFESETKTLTTGCSAL